MGGGGGGISPAGGASVLQGVRQSCRGCVSPARGASVLQGVRQSVMRGGWGW